MSDKLPNLCYYNQQEYSFQKPYSETTARLMDEEVLKMVNEQYDRAKQILSEHKEGHAQLAQLLVDREVIFADDVEKIFGKRPWQSRSEELLEAQMRAEAERMAEERARELEAQGEHEAQGAGNEELLIGVLELHALAVREEVHREHHQDEAYGAEHADGREGLDGVLACALERTVCH